VTARAVQGAFGALLAPAALSLLSTSFTESKDRSKAFGIYGAIAGGGAGVGLLLGGLLTEYASWRWCMFVNVFFAATALIGGVILISPDIDVDVFHEEARAIGTLPQPFVIFGSDHDRFLRLSAALTGQSERLGSLSDVSRLADLKVTFFDVRAFAKGAGHFVVGESPALISLLNRITDIQGAFEADRRARLGLLPGLVLSVQNATQIILRPLTTADAGVRR
jgi:MFS family permease